MLSLNEAFYIAWISVKIARCLIFIPNRTFLVRFGSTSGEFGRAMVRILARRSRAKIPMARPNELFRVSFYKFSKSKLSKKFGISDSIFSVWMSQYSSANIAHLASALKFSFGGKVFLFLRPLNTAKFKLRSSVLFLVKLLFNSSYSNTTLLQSDRNMVAYQVSDLIS